MEEYSLLAICEFVSSLPKILSVECFLPSVVALFLVVVNIAVGDVSLPKLMTFHGIFNLLFNVDVDGSGGCVVFFVEILVGKIGVAGQKTCNYNNYVTKSLLSKLEL